MKIRKTYLAIERLMTTLDDAEHQLFNIRGLVKQMPKDWHVHASDCGYDDNFCTLLEAFFLSHVVDKVNLIDFVATYNFLTKRAKAGGPLFVNTKMKGISS